MLLRIPVFNFSNQEENQLVALLVRSIDAVFEAFNLSLKERRIAECLLERGILRASTVANYCELPRNTVRGLLDKLVGEGFLVRTRRGNTHFYGVEQLGRLRMLLEEKRERVMEEVEQQLAALDQARENFTRPNGSSTKPRVTFYEGEDGIRRVYEDTLLSSERLRSWGSFDANRDALPKYFRTYYKRRAKRGISIKSLHPDSVLAREAQRLDPVELRECVLVPLPRFKVTPEIQVYDNKVNIVSWVDKLGIIIESKEIAEAFKDVFDLSFDGAKALFPDGVRKENGSTRAKKR
jgi:sugar-specific transcriptional regulator TrmB